MISMVLEEEVPTKFLFAYHVVSKRVFAAQKGIVGDGSIVLHSLYSTTVVDDDPSSFDYLGHIRLLTFSMRTAIFPILSEQAFVSKLAAEPTEYTDSFEHLVFPDASLMMILM